MSGKKIVIVGVGAVGATIAYTAVLNKVCKEVVLIDAKKNKMMAEVKDIQHCMSYIGEGVRVNAGTYADVKDADVVIIAAAAPVKFGQTRLDMIQKNISIADMIIPDIIENGFKGIYIVISNPVDVMSYYICKKYQLDTKKVIGTGTVLDTGRLKHLLALELNVPESSVYGYCMGEHGDALVIPWSQIVVEGRDVAYDIVDKDRIRTETIHAAYDIVKGKGNTSYGIAISTFEILKALFSSEEHVLPVSTLMTGQYGIYDVYLSVPSKISHEGVKEVLELNLSTEEVAELTQAAGVLKETLADVEKSFSV